jgi:hypothetical protein
MAKKSDVELTVDLDGVTPTGISINFSIAAIPTCTVDLAPAGPGIIKIAGEASGVLAGPDPQKRREVKVDISVTSHDGKGGKDTKKLKWNGLLDGLSVGNTVGNNTYQAVLKGKGQKLLEVTTLTPGLHPSSVNIYKNPYYSVLGSTSTDNRAEVGWVNDAFSAVLDFDKNPLEFYTTLLTELLKKQQGGYEQYLGDEMTVDSTNALADIFSDNRYQKALEDAVKLMEVIDLSAVTSGTITKLNTSYPNASQKMKDMFSSGPNVILENYVNFLKFMGCTIVFGNEKSWVMPERSFIKPNHVGPMVGKSSKTPNVANPADYNSYMYNDNGYRDFLAVILSNTMPVGGHQVTSTTYEHGLVACYIDDKTQTKASGVLVVPDHPFSMFFYTNENNHADAKKMKERADGGGSYYPEPYQYGANETEENQAERYDEKAEFYEDKLKDIMKNYAETKFYQARYGDRMGSITLEFNPKWVPGAGGTLFVRETNVFLDFYVESVTHRIDMTPPSGATAITIVSFCCGRMGKEPIGVDKDEFLGTDLGKEKAFIQAFIADIGAN